MPKLLEVIVTSMTEAREAELGGADRLELVRGFEHGGLTPSLALVQDLIRSITIPVRVMLRENTSMSIGGAAGLKTLEERASELAGLPIDGVVLGFAKNGRIDFEATRRVLAAVPECRCTFHRAFEHVNDPLLAIRELKKIPQIDRILTNGGDGTIAERVRQLIEWQKAGAPEIRILVASGVCHSFLAAVAAESRLTEIHIGRAARFPPAVEGAVNRVQVSAAKSALI